MSTRLVEGLERAIAQAQDPLERECLKARHAAAIARLGMLEQARFTLAGLRTQSRRHAHPRLQAWVHFVDGSVHYFDSLCSPQASISFKAARDVAAECGDTQLQALSSAWLAAAKMVLARDAGVLDVLAEALQLAAPDNHAALTRAWLVLANLADYAGQIEEAMPCYDLARVHAVADGDSAAVSLMMYNRSNSLISHHVRRELFGTTTTTGFERVLAEIESTSNLNMGLGNTALSTLAQIIRAEALTVVGRFAEAVALIDRHLELHVKETGLPSAARHLSHRAWCRANLQHRELALADAEAVVANLVHVADADDLSVSHQRLANTYTLLNLPERAAPRAKAAAAAMQGLAVQQAELGSLLRQFKKRMQAMGQAWPAA